MGPISYNFDRSGYGVQTLLTGWNSAKLLRDDRCSRVDCAHNCGEKESHTLHGDVHEQEDDGYDQGLMVMPQCTSASSTPKKFRHTYVRITNAPQESSPGQLIERSYCSNLLGFDSSNCEFLFFVRQPARGCGTIGQGPEGNNSNDDGDDACRRSLEYI